MAMLFTQEQKYLPLVTAASQKYNVPVALILGHIKQESSFNPNAYRAEPAINDASMGLMQMLVKTARSFDSSATLEKLRDPAYSIDLGVAYIAQNLKKWPEVKDAIAAYNAGVPRKNEKGQYVNSKGVPNVQSYVDKVYKNYLEYQTWLEHGAKKVDVAMIDPIWVFLFIAAGIGYIVVRRYYGKKSTSPRISTGQRRSIQGSS